MNKLDFISFMQEALLRTAKIQTGFIASEMYREKDKPCHRYDEDKKEWIKDVLKAHKSKEEFESKRARKIAEIWVNYASGLCTLYSKVFTGIDFNIKDHFISVFINQLKELSNE